VISENAPLRWAFYIALAGILFFVAFNIKRRQRRIEVINPNKNTTVEFTETIGRLYLQRKDNRNIAEKMVTYFYEFLRKKYFITTSAIDTGFINSLSGKSGVDKKETQELFELINKIQKEEDVSDEDVLELNLKIENFKKSKADGRKFI
jgi:hypothetical protein